MGFKAGLLLITFALVSRAQAAAPQKVIYGNNPAAGHYATVNGVRLYYEIYGQGEPLLLLHGNGGRIAHFQKQIEFFRTRYRVIAVDSREQGKSADTSQEITYEKMASDFNELLGHLKVGKVNVLGWSDGAINALLLGIRYPDRVKKIAAMAANLSPDEKAVYPEVWAWAHRMLDTMPADLKKSPEGKRNVKVTSMMFSHPHIALTELERIQVPTLVLAGDQDLIRDTHTLDIFHHLKNGELCIFPGSTHMVPWDRPEVFNSAVDRFFREPFRKLDRVKDVEKDLEVLEKLP